MRKPGEIAKVDDLGRMLREAYLSAPAGSLERSVISLMLQLSCQPEPSAPPAPPPVVPAYPISILAILGGKIARWTPIIARRRKSAPAPRSSRVVKAPQAEPES